MAAPNAKHVRMTSWNPQSWHILALELASGRCVIGAESWHEIGTWDCNWWVGRSNTGAAYHGPQRNELLQVLPKHEHLHYCTYT